MMLTMTTRFLSSIFAMIASTANLLTGHGLQVIVGPLLALESGFSEVEIGYQGSAYFCGIIIGCLSIPRLICNVGHIRVFLVLIALATVALLALGLGADRFVWLASKMLSGFCLSGLYMVIESWLNESSTTENRGSVLSLYSVITLLAISFGQLFIGLGPSYEQLLILGAIFILLSTIPVGLSRTASPAPPQVVSFKFRQVYRDSKVALYGAFLCGLVTSGFWALGPIIGMGLNFDKDQIGIFMAVTLFGGAIAQLPVGRYSDLIDRRLVLAGLGLAASVTALLAVSIISQKPGFFFMIMFLFGASTFPIYSISLAHANDNSVLAPIETGSVILLTFSLGSVLGPALISTVQAFSNLAIYWVTLCVLAPFAVITFARSRVIPATQTHFAPYQDVPVTTQEVISLGADEIVSIQVQDSESEDFLDGFEAEPLPTAI